MTSKEAIKHLSLYVGNDCYTDRMQTACKMAISALMEQPRWISVEERLPSGWWIDPETGYSEPEEYIVFVKGATLPTFANFIEGKFTRPDAIYCRDETGFADAITHWMPLPMPPKEEV